MNKVLIDTNVLIYSIDQDSKYFDQAQNIIFEYKWDLFTTSKNLSEFLSVVTRLPGSTLSIRDAITVLNDFISIFTILYPTEHSYMTFLDLLKKYKPAGLQIHDLEIACIGLSNGINRIATFNEKDFLMVEEVTICSI